MEQNIQEKTIQSSPFSIILLIEMLVALLFGLTIFGIFLANYFHLFPLSNNAASSPTNHPAVPVPSSEIAPTSTFTYSSDIAIARLTAYIKTYLKPEFIPAKIDVMHKLSSLGTTTDTDYTFSSQWNQNNDIFFSAYHFNQSSNNERDIGILITHLTVDNASPQDTIKKYFINGDLSHLTCMQQQNAQNQTLKTCESFYTDNNGINHGIGIIVGTVDAKTNTPQTLLFSCELPPKSSSYTWKSCLQPYAEQGIK